MLIVRRLLTRARTALQTLVTACMLTVVVGGVQAADISLYQAPILLNQVGLSAGIAYWDVGAWSLCSVACGPAGTQTRTVTCISAGVPAVDSVCQAFEPKPATSQSCTDYRSCTYSWQVTPIGTCSNSCGTGSQTRDVNCVRSYDGAIAADAACTGPKPDSTANCSDYSSCTYRWMSGVWGACSTGCGTGTQSRVVSCQMETGTVAANSLCNAASMPANTQACTLYSSCTYSWVYSTWSTCSSTCGSGVETRTAICTRSDGTAVAASYCGPQQPLSRACTNYTGCTFGWVQAWGTCSSSCGIGTQSTVNSCQRSDGTAVPTVNCTGVAPAGVAQSCSSFSSCSYSWTYSAWSSCSIGCGTGVQTRTATCTRSDGTTVADSYCTGAKQALAQACSNYTSCTYTWQAGSWSACSSSCTTAVPGTQSRSVTCLRSDGVAVSGTSCTAPTPVTSQSCTDTSTCATMLQKKRCIFTSAKSEPFPGPKAGNGVNCSLGFSTSLWYMNWLDPHLFDGGSNATQYFACLGGNRTYTQWTTGLTWKGTGTPVQSMVVGGQGWTYIPIAQVNIGGVWHDDPWSFMYQAGLTAPHPTTLYYCRTNFATGCSNSVGKYIRSARIQSYSPQTTYWNSTGSTSSGYFVSSATMRDGSQWRQSWIEYSPGPNCAAQGTVRVDPATGTVNPLTGTGFPLATTYSNWALTNP